MAIHRQSLFWNHLKFIGHTAGYKKLRGSRHMPGILKKAVQPCVIKSTPRSQGGRCAPIYRSLLTGEKARPGTSIKIFEASPIVVLVKSTGDSPGPGSISPMVPLTR